MDADIHFLVNDPAWDPLLKSHADFWRDLIAAALRHAPQPLDAMAVSVVLTDNAEIQVLNRDYRGKDNPTNVLSFPQIDDWADVSDGPIPGEPSEIGDIILALGIIGAEAQEQNKPLQDHIAHLLVHGTLHLLGYDHLNDAEAAEMEGLETAILEAYGLADPYND